MVNNEPSKGESVYWPSTVILPEIDFVAIAETSNLQLDDNLCEIIKCVLREYISLVRSWEQKPLSGERKRFLESIKSACELLESVFELDTQGPLENYDPMLFFAWQTIVPSVGCVLKMDSDGGGHLVTEKQVLCDSSERKVLQFSAKNVADYLAMCRANIQREAELPSRPGNRKKYAITRCLKGLHQVYSNAGGEGRGCWWYEGSQSEFRGPFLDFAKGILDYTDYSFSKKSLGNQIIKNIKL